MEGQQTRFGIAASALFDAVTTTTITAANQPTGGAAFSVRLPLQTAPQLEPWSPVAMPSTRPTSRQPWRAA